MKKLVYVLFLILLLFSFTACSPAKSQKYSTFPSTDWGMSADEVIKALKLSDVSLNKDNQISVDNFELFGYNGKLLLIFDDFMKLTDEVCLIQANFETQEVITKDEIEKQLNKQLAKITYKNEKTYHHWFSNITLKGQLTKSQELVWMSIAIPKRITQQKPDAPRWTMEEWTAYLDEAKLSHVTLGASGNSIVYRGSEAALMNRFDQIVDHQWNNYLTGNHAK